MNQVTHILIGTSVHTVPNPYYSAQNSNIEPTTYEKTQQEVKYFQSDEEFKDFLLRNPGMINNSAYTFYKVQELYPKITTTIKIDV